MGEQSAISDSEREAAIDRRVVRRLASDAAYRNAENAEQQQQREDEITEQVEREFDSSRATQQEGAPMQRYIVIENTPGYLSEDDDPLITDDYSAAVEYMNELAARYEDDPDGNYSVEYGIASPDNYAAVYVTDNDSTHPLPRYIGVEIYEDEDEDEPAGMNGFPRPCDSCGTVVYVDRSSAFLPSPIRNAANNKLHNCGGTLATDQTPTPQMIFLPSLPSAVNGTDGFRLRDGSLLSDRLADDSANLPMLQLWHALSGGQNRPEGSMPDNPHFQVVAVYPSGVRYAVRDFHRTMDKAEWHKAACECDSDPQDTWRYEIDVTYTGSDGQRHWRANV